MKEGQKRRYYRLEPSEADPVLVHLDEKIYKAVDMSVTGIKIETHESLSKLEIGQVIDLTIELPNVKPQPNIHTKAKICFMNSECIAFEYVRIESLSTRQISDYLLQRSKNLGYI